MIIDFSEDLFERKHKQGHDHRHPHDHDDYRSSRSRHDGYEDDYEYDRHDHSALIGRLLQNKKLLFMLVVSAIIVLIGFIVAVYLLFPYILKLLNSLNLGGLKGLIESILSVTKQVKEVSGN